MADTHRRLLLLPPDLTAAQRARLESALIDVVQTQNRLAAASPYVLRYTGPPAATSNGFALPHEPATPWRTAQLFDPGQPPAEPDVLLRTAAGLLDALESAHTAAGRPVVHGGLCPGAVLDGADGLLKVTDFGLAPAICQVLGVDAYLNLAVSAGHDASGAWEVLSESNFERDDRLCAFIDPDKYGQDTLTTFEAGSDLIAAGLLLHLLATHVHPYLHFAPDAHRVVDMARMMSFGVPIAISAPALTGSPRPEVRACCQLVLELLARLPRERPAAREATARLVAAGYKVQLDLQRAERWVTQLEALLAGSAWRDLELVLKDRPALASWPADLEARAAAVALRAETALDNAAAHRAVEEDERRAMDWLRRVQLAAEANDWESADKLLTNRPRLKHWPEVVLTESAQLEQRVGQEKRIQGAREWQRALKKAYESHDWASVARRFARRPDEDICPPEVRAYAAEVEQEYEGWLAQEEARRKQIETDHEQVRSWLNEAERLAAAGDWIGAVDLLGEPPDVEHWPARGREQAEKLKKEWLLQWATVIAGELPKITNRVRGLAVEAVRAAVRPEQTAFLDPKALEVLVEDVLLGLPDEEAGGRGPVRVRLRPARGVPPAPCARGEIVFRLRGLEPEILGGATELTAAVAAALPLVLPEVQQSQIGAFAEALRASVYADADVRAAITPPVDSAVAEVRLLGATQSDPPLQVKLAWNPATLGWEPADKTVFAEMLRAGAAAALRHTAVADLVERVPLLKPYAGGLSVEPQGEPRLTPDGWPAAFEGSGDLVLRAPGLSGPQILGNGPLSYERVDVVAFSIPTSDIVGHLNHLLLLAQERGRDALASELRRAAKASGAKINAPKRVTGPVEELVFGLQGPSASTELRALWSPQDFRFVFPPGWEEQLGQVLGAAAAAIDTEVKTQLPTHDEPTAKRSPRKVQPQRTVLIGGVAAGVVGVAIVGFVIFGGGNKDGNPTPGTGPGAQPLQNGTVLPTPNHGNGAPVEPPTVDPGPDAGPGSVEPPPVVLSAAERFLASWPVARELEEGADPRAAVVLPAVVAGLAEADDALSAAIANLVAATGTGGSVSVAAAVEAGLPADAVEVVLQWQLRSGGDVRIVTRFAPVGSDSWVALDENASAVLAAAEAARNAVESSFTGALAEMQAHAVAGELRLFHARAAEARTALAIFPDLPGSAQYTTLVASQPPPWNDDSAVRPTGRFEAATAERDPSTGYPILVEYEDRQLALIAVAPHDPVWSELGSVVRDGEPLARLVRNNEALRPWELFYVDVDELPVEGFNAALTAFPPGSGLTLVTRDAWFLAALRSRGGAPLAGMLLGGWEWCADAPASEDGRRWLVGGSRLLAEIATGPVARPSPAADTATWYRWLTQPLVMQRRLMSFGDELTAARGMLRVFP